MKRGVTSKEFAQRMSMSKQYYSFFENGMKVGLTIHDFIMFCQSLDLDPAEAFEAAYVRFISEPSTTNMQRYREADRRAFNRYRDRNL